MYVMPASVRDSQNSNVGAETPMMNTINRDSVIIVHKLEEWNLCIQLMTPYTKLIKIYCTTMLYSMSYSTTSSLTQEIAPFFDIFPRHVVVGNLRFL